MRVKDTDHFLSKLKDLWKLTTRRDSIDVVGLYPNMPNSKGLISFRRFLELRYDKQISSDTVTELAKIVLKTTKKLLNRYLESQLEQGLHPHVVSCI